MAYPMYGGYMQQQQPNPYTQFNTLQEQINRVQPTQPVQTTQPTSNVSWVFVSSEQQARDYAVVPSNTMWFMNSENSEIYAKACDQMGMTNFKAFTITEKQQKKEEVISPVDYVPRSEFDKLKSEIEIFLSQSQTQTQQETKKGGTK